MRRPARIQSLAAEGKRLPDRVVRSDVALRTGGRVRCGLTKLRCTRNGRWSPPIPHPPALGSADLEDHPMTAPVRTVFENWLSCLRFHRRPNRGVESSPRAWDAAARPMKFLTSWRPAAR